MVYKVIFYNGVGKKYEFLFESLKEAMVFNGKNLKEGRKSEIVRMDLEGKEVCSN